MIFFDGELTCVLYIHDLSLSKNDFCSHWGRKIAFVEKVSDGEFIHRVELLVKFASTLLTVLCVLEHLFNWVLDRFMRLSFRGKWIYYPVEDTGEA